MKKIEKYGLVIIKQKKILINRKMDTRLFLLPGGKPKKGETAEQCLRREIKEEHNVDIIGSPKPFGTYEDKAANESNTKIHMKVYLGDIKGEPTPGSEIVEQRWFGKDDNPSILSPIVKYEIIPALLMENLL